MNNIECIYIINLEKERSRLKQTLMLLADEEIFIPIKIFRGTYWDTKEFKNDILNKEIRVSNFWENESNSLPGQQGNKLKLGQAACCYSHMKLLEDVVKNNYKTILLLQDDVYCNNIGELKLEIDKYHNLIKKHNDFDLYYIGKQPVFRGIKEKKYKDTNFLETEYCWNCHAVIFSLNCCKKLLNTQIFNEVIPFDEFLPLCFGKSRCKNKDHFEYIFPPIIKALSSDTYNKVFQVLYSSSRYKHLIESYSTTDISDSPNF
tara:strand:+ start:83 stop:865 length:783 start_codon:yes stop_codon:yes gene_type:complete